MSEPTMNSLTGMRYCPKVEEDWIGHCVQALDHSGPCLPSGGHNPPTLLEQMNRSWAAGWRPENVDDDAHEDWLETGEGGSSWLRDQEDRDEARANGLMREG